MQLADLGFGPNIQHELDLVREARQSPDLHAGRVVVEHRGAYEVMTEAGSRWAELPGRLRHRAENRLDLPSVGDWVALAPDGRIEAVLPRRSALVRKAAGLRREPQLIAANIDWVFIVTSANADFNPRRIERYIVAVRESGASPVLIINKTDLCEDVSGLVASLGAVGAELPVLRVSAKEKRGWDELAEYLTPRATVALVGSSGVGKSTLANWLLGAEAQETAPIREHDTRGRHTTTQRELILLSTGAALIDTPGMREFGLWSEDEDLTESFSDIESLAAACKFSDCQHGAEPGCAIQHALGAGELDPIRLASYEKLRRELSYQRDRGSVAMNQAQKRAGRSQNRALRQRKKGPQGSKLR